MLVLTRRAGESVFMTDTRTGEHLGEVKFIAYSSNGTLRIGFECPKHIAIVRDNANPLKEEADAES
jgi:sRNA-binding carbon storage regulator CsrA